MSQQITVPGAVGVAIKCKDGVILGNDRRATWGYTVTNKSTKKVFLVSERVGFTAYGLIGFNGASSVTGHSEGSSCP